jgi:hypothetical protein
MRAKRIKQKDKRRDEMSQPEKNMFSQELAVDARWKGLYRLGGLSILISLIMIPVSIIVYIAWPMPHTAIEAYTLFKKSTFAGLLSLDLIYLVCNILAIPVFLALYMALRRSAETTMLIAITLGLGGIAALLSARPILEIYSVSRQYALAETEIQRAAYLAIGDGLLAHLDGTAFQLHYFLGSASFLIASLVMLRSRVFSNSTAWAGILANTLVFGLYVPKIGVILSILSVFPFLAIWYFLIARRFFQLGKAEGKVPLQEA